MLFGTLLSVEAASSAIYRESVKRVLNSFVLT